MLNAAIGVKVSHVPYRDIGPLTQDMIAGRVDYQCPLPGTMIPLIETNKVKGIARSARDGFRPYLILLVHTSKA
jgi:tripartite-type tricarboxylate transporter receptor subunit TctC